MRISFGTLRTVLLLSALLLLRPGAVQAQQFSLYAYAFMNQEQRPAIQVNVSIGYNTLVFFKSDNSRYESTCELYLKLLDQKKRIVDTAVLKKTVGVPEYRDTKSAKRNAKLSRQFDVAPGTYEIEATVTVRNTQLKRFKTVTVTVPDFLASGIGIGTPRLYAVPRRLLERHGPLVEEDLIPESDRADLETASFASIDKIPALRIELFTAAGVKHSLSGTLYLEVSDERKNQYFYHRSNVELSGRGDAFFILLGVDEWALGGYRMNAKIVMNDPRREAVASLRFRIGFTRAMLDRYFDDTLDILAIIATKDELNRLEAASREERAKEWAAFWDRRDPSPGTEANEALDQYLERIQYVSTHFSNAGPGWRSDRGKIYLRYGQPDEVESTIDSYVQGEYLIWRYYELNLVFVFYDRFYGVGDFRLISTNAY